MTRWGVFIGILSVASLLLLTACDSQVSGTAQPDPAALRSLTPLTGAGAFGDASTVDPCSIVDVHKLAADLHAALEPADSFDDCPVSVTLSDGTPTDVYVGPLETGQDKSRNDLRRLSSLARGMTLFAVVDPSPGFCTDYLKFQDDFWLDVAASTTDPASKADTCPAAEALVRNAAAQIAAGTITHRTYPTYSVGSLDPCTLVSDSTLTGVGLAGVAPLEYPESHECIWLSSTGNDWLRAQFGIGKEPAAYDPSTETTTQLAGRKTLISPFLNSSTSASCWARTGLHKYGDSATLVEIAMVEMHTGDGNTTNACDRAKVVAATAVWPLLPPASS